MKYFITISKMRKIKFYRNWDFQSIVENNRFTGTLHWIIDYYRQSIISNTENIIDYTV